jgi:hypothetical protein
VQCVTSSSDPVQPVPQPGPQTPPESLQPQPQPLSPPQPPPQVQPTNGPTTHNPIIAPRQTTWPTPGAIGLFLLVCLSVCLSVLFVYNRRGNFCMHRRRNNQMRRIPPPPAVDVLGLNPVTPQMSYDLNGTLDIPATGAVTRISSEHLWKEAWSDEYQRAYYTNPLSGETTWLRPAATK